MKVFLAAALLAAGCAASPAPARVPGFPGAEGAGAMSLGGRGGRVLRVTNLNDGGTGSLRAAIEAEGPRTVVFDIGGTITLKKPLFVRNPRITIAGQTAPGGGITLRGQPFGVLADDVVVRFIRSRLGDESGAVGDAVWVARGNRIILDHVSASWGTDEVLSVASTYKRPGRELGDVTVQWSIIAESLCNSVNPEGRHCFGSILSGSRGARISFHHNLMAHHAARMPRLGNALPPAQDGEGAFFDVRSNLLYNWGGREAGYSGPESGRMAYNFVGNSYLPGPDSRGDGMFKENSANARGFFAANSVAGAVLREAAAKVAATHGHGFLLRGPVAVAAVRGESAEAASRQVLAHAGASLVRDSVDERIVADVRGRSGRLIDSQREVGGWPQLAAGTPWRDRDRDGMPDSWERAHRLDPGDPRDGVRDADGDGYTNLEEWLNSLVPTF